MTVSIDEAEKVATEFLMRKIKDVTEINVHEATMSGNDVKVSGTLQDPRYKEVGISNWEITVDKEKVVTHYKIL
jgi:hypothetical protein